MAHKQKIINLNITFRHTEATDALRTYAVEKITNCLQKFVHHDTEGHVVLCVEKNRQLAEFTAHVDGITVNATGEGDKLYTAIDKLVDILTQQLRKHKEKLTAHH